MTSSSDCNPILADVGVEAAEGLCAQVYRDELVVESSRPRALFVHNGQVFALERGGAFNEWETLTGHVMAYFDDGATSETLVSAVGLTHGLTVDDSYIYASSADTVYRWSYTFEEGQFIVGEDAQVVIENIPSTSDQALHTRSLLLDGETLYVSIGAEQDVEPDLGRAGIRTFSLPTDDVTLPLNWTEGTVIATGLRNAAGMALDASGTLWAVDSSADEKYREDLGGDLSLDNPADELNKIVSSGSNTPSTYGFPFCWSEHQLNATVSNGRGAQWAWHDPEIFPVPMTDEWCRDTTNNIPPENVFPAHSVPLGVTFYNYQETWPDHCPDGVAFPASWNGHAFVAYHGSYFRDVPVAGEVVRVPVSAEGDVVGGIAADPISVLKDIDSDALSGIRPVDVKFDDCGRLLITSDGRTRDLEGRMILRVQSSTATTSNMESSDVGAPAPAPPAETTPTMGDSSSSGVWSLNHEFCMLYALVLLLSMKFLRH